MRTAKTIARKKLVVKISYSPDYDHEAWGESETEPTPATMPDAFYCHREPAYPTIKAEKQRRKLHEGLSRRALKKRLFQTGLRGAELYRIAAEIKAGPTMPDDKLGVVALGWNVDALRKRFGRRIARAVLRFVRTLLLIIDEAWQLMSSPEMSAAFGEMFMSARKVSSAGITAEQSAI